MSRSFHQVTAQFGLLAFACHSRWLKKKRALSLKIVMTLLSLVILRLASLPASAESRKLSDQMSADMTRLMEAPLSRDGMVLGWQNMRERCKKRTDYKEVLLAMDKIVWLLNGCPRYCTSSLKDDIQNELSKISRFSEKSSGIHTGFAETADAVYKRSQKGWPES